ncbi:helix-turn-helix domain-containing protein [Epilithonimonas sp. UC225_85]|uniref:helix-turn-helix domain-containing protein n=1 Tax=Epilithonimonas sp. UC225_85 TaxID=3350167 RepID=UPI0036D3C300
MRRLLFLWFLLFSGVVLMPAQSSPETLQLLDKAYKSLYENPDNALQILQNIDKNKESEIIQQRLQLILARSYNLKGDYTTSVDQSTDKNLNANGKERGSFYMDFALAQQYQALRLYKQSIRISENLVKQASKIKAKNYTENLLAQVYQLNAANFMVQKNWEKAEENLDKSNNSLKNSESDFMISIENKIYQTLIYLSQNQINNAEKITTEIEKNLNNRPQYIYLKAYNLDNLGRINFLKKDYEKSSQNLNQALELVQNTSFEPLKNKIYDDLSKNYLALKNEDLYQKFYTNYKEGSDKLDQNKKEAIRHLILLNDQYENKRIEDSESSFAINIFIISGISFTVILVIFLFNFFEKKKTESIQKQIDFYTKQQEFITKINKKEAIPDPVFIEKTEAEIIKKPLLISKEKENDILARLEEFEKSEKFLNRDMSLAVLAGQMETNTKYLSEIINKYKEKNYNNYINELRINYIAYLLKTEPVYLSYKVSYLAEKAGFSSHSSFTTVFKSVTGISPNTYIQQLTQNKK